MALAPYRFLQANGLEFGLIEAGSPERPLVLCLHGFPDSAESFRPLLAALSAGGYRGVAVAMRGYLPSSRPADGDYAALSLARDAIALIDHLGARQAVLVGHDWGAVAGYLAAALRPDRVRALVAAAVPHPRRLLLRPGRAQLWRSRYMAQFQWPGVESSLRAANFQALRDLAQRWSPRLDVGQALAPVWAGFSDPERLRAALAYYRAMPGALVSPEAWRQLLAPTPVPACLIHGPEDGCIGADLFQDQDHLFAAGLRQQMIPETGHFMHLERPQAFSALVLDFLADLPAAA